MIARGGYHKVSDDLNWAEICRELHVVSTSASFSMKRVYYQYLYDYEQAHYFPGMMKNLRIDSRTVLERFKNYDNRNVFSSFKTKVTAFQHSTFFQLSKNSLVLPLLI